MKLEDIGFYTLSDHRAMNSSITSPLYRCEIILTDKCNFKCPYCRGLRPDLKGSMDLDSAKDVIKLWLNNGLKNIRFSGGEPTMYNGLTELVELCRDNGVERIAISTNGSNSFRFYSKLVSAGVNDFSISLDACCATVGNIMSGGVKCWSKVVENIKALSEVTYVSVGMVFTEKNVNECLESVLFADSLGVSDIRVIPSAQYNQALLKLKNLPEDIINKYPILKYRINNVKIGRHVRGISNGNRDRCWLALDDMAVAGDRYHFPCVIYLREGGNPIGKVDENFRLQRMEWIANHKPWEDPICMSNCLDVCVDYNKRASGTHSVL